MAFRGVESSLEPSKEVYEAGSLCYKTECQNFDPYKQGAGQALYTRSQQALSIPILRWLD